MRVVIENSDAWYRDMETWLAQKAEGRSKKATGISSLVPPGTLKLVAILALSWTATFFKMIWIAIKFLVGLIKK